MIRLSGFVVLSILLVHHWFVQEWEIKQELFYYNPTGEFWPFHSMLNYLFVGVSDTWFRLEYVYTLISIWALYCLIWKEFNITKVYILKEAIYYIIKKTTN